MYVKNKGNENQNSSFPVISLNFAALSALEAVYSHAVASEWGSGTQVCYRMGVLTHRCA